MTAPVNNIKLLRYFVYSMGIVMALGMVIITYTISTEFPSSNHSCLHNLTNAELEPFEHFQIIDNHIVLSILDDDGFQTFRVINLCELNLK